MWNIKRAKVKHNQRVWDSLKPDLLREKDTYVKNEISEPRRLLPGPSWTPSKRSVMAGYYISEGSAKTNRWHAADRKSEREQGCEGPSVTGKTAN